MKRKQTSVWLLFAMIVGVLSGTLAQAIEGDGVGSVSANFGVGAGGGVDFSMGFAVVGGPGGIGANLGIAYGGGQGVFGVGMSLTGLSSITRCNRQVVYDGQIAGVAWSKDDALCLDGNRMKVKKGTAGEVGAVYETQAESYSKIEQLGGSLDSMSAYFKVWHRDGTISYYGGLGNAQTKATVYVEYDNGGLEGKTWLLSRVENRQGVGANYYYQQVIDQQTLGGVDVAYSDQVLLDKITYTTAAIVDNRQVDVRYDCYDEIGGNDPRWIRYALGVRNILQCKVESIVSLVGQEEVSRYDFTYETSQMSGRARLKEIGYCANQACLKPLTLEWTDQTLDKFVFSGVKEVSDSYGLGLWEEEAYQFDGSVYPAAVASYADGSSGDVEEAMEELYPHGPQELHRPAVLQTTFVRNRQGSTGVFAIVDHDSTHEGDMWPSEINTQTLQYWEEGFDGSPVVKNYDTRLRLPKNDIHSAGYGFSAFTLEGYGYNGKHFSKLVGQPVMMVPRTTLTDSRLVNGFDIVGLFRRDQDGQAYGSDQVFVHRFSLPEGKGVSWAQPLHVYGEYGYDIAVCVIDYKLEYKNLAEVLDKSVNDDYYAPYNATGWPSVTDGDHYKKTGQIGIIHYHAPEESLSEYSNTSPYGEIWKDSRDDHHNLGGDLEFNSPIHVESMIPEVAPQMVAGGADCSGMDTINALDVTGDGKEELLINRGTSAGEIKTLKERGEAGYRVLEFNVGLAETVTVEDTATNLPLPLPMLMLGFDYKSELQVRLHQEGVTGVEDLELPRGFSSNPCRQLDANADGLIDFLCLEATWGANGWGQGWDQETQGMSWERLERLVMGGMHGLEYDADTGYQPNYYALTDYPMHSRVYYNLGNKRFEAESSQTKPLITLKYDLKLEYNSRYESIILADYNNDGRTDLMIPRIDKSLNEAPESYWQAYLSYTPSNNNYGGQYIAITPKTQAGERLNFDVYYDGVNDQAWYLGVQFLPRPRPALAALGIAPDLNRDGQSDFLALQSEYVILGKTGDELGYDRIYTRWRSLRYEGVISDRLEGIRTGDGYEQRVSYGPLLPDFTATDESLQLPYPASIFGEKVEATHYASDWRGNRCWYPKFCVTPSAEVVVGYQESITPVVDQWTPVAYRSWDYFYEDMIGSAYNGGMVGPGKRTIVESGTLGRPQWRTEVYNNTVYDAKRQLFYQAGRASEVYSYVNLGGINENLISYEQNNYNIEPPMFDIEVYPYRITNNGKTSKSYEDVSCSNESAGLVWHCGNMTADQIGCVPQLVCRGDELAVSTPLSHTQSTQELDAHGNIEYQESNEYTPFGVYTNKTWLDYDYDVANHLFDRVKFATTEQLTPAGSRGVHVVGYEYGNGSPLLKKVIAEPLNPAKRVELRIDSYDNFGNAKTITYDNGKTTPLSAQKVWSSDGRYLKEEINTLGHVTKYQWDEVRGLVKEISDPNGLKQVMEYDAFGRLIYSQTYSGLNQKLDNGISIDREPLNVGYKQTLTSFGLGQHESWHDMHGRLTHERWQGPQGAWVKREQRYSPYGQLSLTSTVTYESEFGNGLWHSRSYDNAGRLLTQEDPEGRQVNYVYDGRQVAVIDPEGHVSVAEDLGGGNRKNTRGYGTLDSSSVCIWNGLSAANEVTIDRLCGQMGGLTPWRFVYNEDGQLALSETAQGAVNYTYNADGDVETVTDAVGNLRRYVYDALGRVDSVTYQDGNEGNQYEVDYVWDTLWKGALSRVSGFGFSTGYLYDQFGRRRGADYTVEGKTYEERLTYTALNQLKTYQFADDAADQVVPKVTIEHVYDNFGDLTQVRNATDPSQVYWQALEYDAQRRVIEEQYGNGITSNRQYDAITGALKRIDSENAQASILQAWSYDYKDNGNIASRHNELNGLEEQYVYDALDRLTQTLKVEGPNFGAQETSFDALGRITQTSSQGSYVYDLNHPDRLVSAGDYQLQQYDASGALTFFRQGDKSYEIIRNVLGKPRQIITTDDQGNEIGEEMHYDWSGSLRVRQRNADNKITYLGGLQIEQLEPSELQYRYQFTPGYGVVQLQYDVSGGVLNNAKPVVTYLLTDRQGSPDVSTGSSGQVQEQVAYDPWGSGVGVASWDPEQGVSQIIGMNYGYTGHEGIKYAGDDKHGWTNMGGRLQHAQLQVFDRPDRVANVSSASDMNPYSYVEGKPTNFTDPSGWCKTNAADGGGQTGDCAVDPATGAYVTSGYAVDPATGAFLTGPMPTMNIEVDTTDDTTGIATDGDGEFEGGDNFDSWLDNEDARALEGTEWPEGPTASQAYGFLVQLDYYQRMGMGGGVNVVGDKINDALGLPTYGDSILYQQNQTAEDLGLNPLEVQEGRDGADVGATAIGIFAGGGGLAKLAGRLLAEALRRALAPKPKPQQALPPARPAKPSSDLRVGAPGNGGFTISPGFLRRLIDDGVIENVEHLNQIISGVESIGWTSDIMHGSEYGFLRTDNYDVLFTIPGESYNGVPTAYSPGIESPATEYRIIGVEDLLDMGIGF